MKNPAVQKAYLGILPGLIRISHRLWLDKKNPPGFPMGCGSNRVWLPLSSRLEHEDDADSVGAWIGACFPVETE